MLFISHQSPPGPHCKATRVKSTPQGWTHREQKCISVYLFMLWLGSFSASHFSLTLLIEPHNRLKQLRPDSNHTRRHSSLLWWRARKPQLRMSPQTRITVFQVCKQPMQINGATMHICSAFLTIQPGRTDTSHWFTGWPVKINSTG